MSITGLFLFGVAGAGKSYFAECFAGTTGRHFVMLDLAHFMSLPNPTKAIDDVFVFLLSQKENYLLLIDEIEKMFQLDGSSTNLVSEQIFGKMLTWLANIYESKNSNLTFVATANRVENLLKNKPEFVRRGRFDRLYFLNYPKVETSAPEIFKMYLNKERKNIVKALTQQFEN
jgi:SpoVK/Ycf46/Vps4 family AAA+-type ATPase